MARQNKADDFLEESKRAEDILLGSLGFGEDARIIALTTTATGFRGRGRYSDGEEFDFESDAEPDDLETWAIQVLLKSRPDLGMMQKAS